MASASKNFSRRELACRGCRHGCARRSAGRPPLCNVDPRALAALERFRALAGVPVILNSACRCGLHNARVGGAPLSDHRGEGRGSTGFDIRITKALPKERILRLALEAGFNALGERYRSFVHVGLRPGNRIRRW